MFVFGLGNPGSKYKNTRHNVGFMTVERIAALKGVKFRKRCFCNYRTAYINGRNDILVEPLTYMNNSGEVIPSLIKEGDKLIVICDQLDLPPGRVKIKKRSGSAGHNGLKSIISFYGEDFIHVYIGIGRPDDGDIIKHVLSDFSCDEKSKIEEAVETAGEAVLDILDGKNIDCVIARVNSR